MVISDDGTIIRMAVQDISTQSRNTQGVRLMRLGADSRVVALTSTEKNEEEEIEQEAVETAEAAVPAMDPDASLDRLLGRAQGETEEEI